MGKPSASPEARLEDLLDFVRPVELVPILLEASVEQPRASCWQRSTVVTQQGEILGTICACPGGKHRLGVGCIIKRSDCAIARKWDKRNIREEKQCKKKCEKTTSLADPVA